MSGPLTDSNGSSLMGPDSITLGQLKSSAPALKPKVGFKHVALLGKFECIDCYSHLGLTSYTMMKTL